MNQIFEIVREHTTEIFVEVTSILLAFKRENISMYIVHTSKPKYPDTTAKAITAKRLFLGFVATQY